jgi:hypothetical protein
VPIVTRGDSQSLFAAFQLSGKLIAQAPIDAPVRLVTVTTRFRPNRLKQTPQLLALLLDLLELLLLDELLEEDEELEPLGTQQ